MLERAALGYGLAAGLSLRPGDRVILLAQNCPEYIECLFGCWYAALLVVPVNAKLHPQEVAFVLQNSGARAAFVSADLASSLNEAIGIAGVALSVIDKLSRVSSNSAGPQSAMVWVNRSDPAWLFYTSGTTGRPKARHSPMAIF